MSEVIRLQEVRVVSGVGFHFLPLFLMISQRSILQTTAATTAQPQPVVVVVVQVHS